MESNKEKEIIAKILLESHVPVQGLEQLPGQSIRKSEAVTVIKRALENNNWFPFEVKDWGKVNDSYHAAFPVIQKDDGMFIVHSYADPESERTLDEAILHIKKTFNTAQEAIDVYLKAREGNLDGATIDWEK